jgi:glycosyltransferase involved in cell wall biosynthesis
MLEDDPDCRQLHEAQAQGLRELLQFGDVIDIVHAHSLDIPGVLYSTGLFADFPIPNVTTLHSSIELRDYAYFRGCTNRIVACSANQWKACPAPNVMGAIHHGLDPSLYPFVAEPENYLCFVGRLDPVKQPDQAIELAIQCNMKIKVAGNIPSSDAKRYYASRIAPRLHHRLVEFVGEVGFDEKVALIANARCNLHPTGFREPFGLSVIEAGFSGRRLWRSAAVPYRRSFKTASPAPWSRTSWRAAVGYPHALDLIGTGSLRLIERGSTCSEWLRSTLRSMNA